MLSKTNPKNGLQEGNGIICSVYMISANSSGLFDERLSAIADEDLVDLLKDGSGEALTILFDRYHGLVLHVTLRIVADRG